MNLTIKDWTSGDWIEIWDADTGKEIHRGHSVPDFVWIDLLRQAGVNVTEEDIESDDED